MGKVELITPVLSGPRFADNAIPMAVLSDLTALTKLVTTIAKWLYLERNPDRKQCPRGFTSPSRLKLSHIGSGSAAPSIWLADESPTLADDQPSYAEYYQEASGLVIKAVASDASSDLFPRSYYALFDPIGRNLLDNEQMTIKTPIGEQSGVINQIRRRELVAKANAANVSSVMTIRGKIPRTDVDKRTFQIEPLHGGRINAPITPEHYDVIMDIQRDYETDHNIVTVTAVGFHSRNGNRPVITEVSDVEPLDPMAPEAQIESLSRLRDGWLDGDGQAPDPRRLHWLAEQFALYYPYEAPQPYVYPTPEGDVQVEWTFNSTEVEISVSLASGIAEWLATNVDTMESSDATVDLNHPGDWQWLVAELSSLQSRSQTQTA